MDVTGGCKFLFIKEYSSNLQQKDQTDHHLDYFHKPDPKLTRHDKTFFVKTYFKTLLIVKFNSGLKRNYHVDFMFILTEDFAYYVNTVRISSIVYQIIFLLLFLHQRYFFKILQCHKRLMNFLGSLQMRKVFNLARVNVHFTQEYFTIIAHVVFITLD